MRANSVSVLRWIIPISLVCAIIWGGCSKQKGPATAQVTGTVMLDGVPVEGANVLFAPPVGSDDARLASQAVTDSTGRYQLQTHIGGGKFKPGVVPGKYDITIVKLDTAAIKNMLSPPKNLLPTKYADPKTSQLKADIVEGKPNDVPLTLKSQ